MKIIFAGTTDFGIPTLEKLKKEHELVLIITQPDKPTGRNKALTPPPIKIWAERNNIPLQQPDKISNIKSLIQNTEPDLMIVAAYGQIIPLEVLEIPKFKSINIHGSLLPKHRGASPIQAAIINQDEKTGVTLIQMDEKMDHGPIIAKSEVALTGTEPYTELHKTLAEAGANLVYRILPEWFEGKLKPEIQNHPQASFTKLITRADAKIEWSKPAKEIYALIRALNPEPGTWTNLDGKSVKILKASIQNDTKIELPGKIYVHNGHMNVKALDNSLVIEQIQPEGKGVMTGKDFLNGLKTGSKLFI